MLLAGIGQVSDFGLTAIAEPIRLGARERALRRPKIDAASPSADIGGIKALRRNASG